MSDVPRHTGLKFLLLLWFAIMVGSFLAFQWTVETGDGFTRGLNRVMAFVGWQFAGLIIALICLFLRARVEWGRPLRWIALVPALVAGTQVLGFVAMYLAASAGML